MRCEIPRAKRTLIMTTRDDLKDLLREIVQGFTRFHGDLKIEQAETPNTVQLNIQTHRDDMGKLLGARGSMIQSLRIIFEAIGENLDCRVKIEPTEPVTGEKQPQPPYQFNPHTKAEQFVPLLSKLTELIWHDGVAVTVKDTGEETSYLLIDAEPEAELETALSNVMHATGKNFGRKIYVEIA